MHVGFMGLGIMVIAMAALPAITRVARGASGTV